MDFKQRIAELNLPENSYVVVGSGILGALGIRESSDIDLVVTEEAYDKVEKLGWQHGKWGEKVVLQDGVFDVGKDWYGEHTEDLLKRAQIIDGVPYLSLNEVYEWKRRRGQDKDLRDLKLIDNYRPGNPDTVYGAIIHPGEHLRKDSLFRASLKAVIFNERQQILVVKERGRDWWDIPGGGLEHGETIKEALARELNEEVSLSGDFEFEPLLVEDPRYLNTHNLYQMRITFIVRPSSMIFKSGIDGDEVQFVDADQYRESDLWTERQIFKYSQLAKLKHY